MLTRSHSLKTLLSKILCIAIASWFCAGAAIVHAADIQPGEQIFCAFPTNKSGADSYKLNLRKKLSAYLINDKRKIALKFSRALDSNRLLWNIPANAKTGKYTFKVVKKQNKSSKQYFSCGKAKDYRLTNKPANVATTQNPDGTLVTNIEGISQAPENGSNGSNTATLVLTPTPPLLVGGITGYGYSGYGVSVSLLLPSNDNLLENNSTIYSGYTQTVGGGSLSNFNPELCVAKIKDNYWDFTAYTAQAESSMPVCSSLEAYKTYITNAINTIEAVCGGSQMLVIDDQSYSVVEKINSLVQMQADAAAIASGDTASQ